PASERCPGAAHRGFTHPTLGSAQLRSAGPVSKLPVSGRVVGPTAAGDRQGRAPPRGTLPSGGLHRDHLDRDEPSRRPLLQSARDGRAVDQGGQGSHPLDAPLVPPLPGRRGTPRDRPDGKCRERRLATGAEAPPRREAATGRSRNLYNQRRRLARTVPVTEPEWPAASRGVT